MKLSIVVATYNRAASLLRLLDSIAAMDAPRNDWECLVVNNNCTDSTEEDFKTFAAVHQDMNLRMVECSEQGLSAARNCGIKESKGEFIAFVDDDETVVPGFAGAYLRFFGESSAFVAGGSVEVVYESARPRWMSKYLEQMIANPIDLPADTRRFPRTMIPAGGNMAFNRHAFSLHGMFKTSLGRKGKSLIGGEETEMFSRIRTIGEGLYYVADARIFHHIPDSRLTAEYVDRLSFAVGQSKRLRTSSRRELEALYSEESKKQMATRLIALWMCLTFRADQAKWLMRMRKGIVRGVHTKAE